MLQVLPLCLVSPLGTADNSCLLIDWQLKFPIPDAFVVKKVFSKSRSKWDDIYQLLSTGMLFSKPPPHKIILVKFHKMLLIGLSQVMSLSLSYKVKHGLLKFVRKSKKANNLHVIYELHPGLRSGRAAQMHVLILLSSFTDKMRLSIMKICKVYLQELPNPKPGEAPSNPHFLE